MVTAYFEWLRTLHPVVAFLLAWVSMSVAVPLCVAPFMALGLGDDGIGDGR